MNATAFNTIAKETSVTSKGLMTGIESTARLVPSDVKGIRFHVGDAVVEANVDNVVSTEHCTVIGNDLNHHAVAAAQWGFDAFDHECG